MISILQVVLAASTLSFAAPAQAPILGIPGLERRLAALKPLHQWTAVNMRVSGGAFADVSEPQLKINLTGSRWGGGLDLNGAVDGKQFNVHASRFGRGWSLSGVGIDLQLSAFGGGWQLFGTVDGNELRMNLDRFGSGLSIWGQGGVSLSASGFGSGLIVSGSIDQNQFDRQRLAALGAAIAALLR